LHEPGQRPYDLAERCWYTSGMILVVDHDPDVLEMAAKILNRDRQVFLATTAKQAFEILARLNGFSVVLVDLDLPGDPYALIQKLHNLDPALLIVATSGAMTASLRDATAAPEVVAVLKKPVTPEWKPVGEPLRAQHHS
jgi:CheY-like chemotaxis protein